MISKEEFLKRLRHYLSSNVSSEEMLRLTGVHKMGRGFFSSVVLFFYIVIFVCFAEKNSNSVTRVTMDTETKAAFILLICFLVLPVVAFFVSKNLIKQKKSKISSFILSLFGLTYRKHAISKEILKKSGLFEDYLINREDDGFSGQILNTQFSVVEYNIAASAFDVDKTAFKNRIYIKIDLKKRFFAHTQIINKKMPLTNYDTKVNLEDIEFIKDFSVFSSDQIEARKILTPAFIEKIKKLKMIYGGERMDVAFFDNIILFAINVTDDMFQIFQQKRYVLDVSFYERFYDEINAIYDMIKFLNIENTG